MLAVLLGLLRGLRGLGLAGLRGCGWSVSRQQATGCMYNVVSTKTERAALEWFARRVGFSSSSHGGVTSLMFLQDWLGTCMGGSADQLQLYAACFLKSS